MYIDTQTSNFIFPSSFRGQDCYIWPLFLSLAGRHLLLQIPFLLEQHSANTKMVWAGTFTVLLLGLLNLYMDNVWTRIMFWSRQLCPLPERLAYTANWASCLWTTWSVQLSNSSSNYWLQSLNIQMCDQELCVALCLDIGLCINLFFMDYVYW